MKNDYETVTMDPIQRQLWRSPFTSVLTFTLAMGVVGALVYIFAFSDTLKQRVEHAVISLTILLWLALLLAFVKKIEDRKIFPLWMRRIVWFGIFASYVGGLLLLLWPVSYSSSDPIGKFQVSIRMGLAAPVPFLAWRLFRDKNA